MSSEPVALPSPLPSAAPSGAPPPTPEDRLRQALRRCSPATIDAALAYHHTREARHLPVIVQGIIERHVDRERRSLLADGGDHLDLAQDLGLDSLTRMEIVLLAEEILPITIDNEALVRLRTIGEVKQHVQDLLRVAA